MLPRRCKNCRLYIAPQFRKCPKCKTIAPVPTTGTGRPTKADKLIVRSKADAKLPLLRAWKMVWQPSAFSMQSHHALLEEVRRKMAKEESPRARNALRSEIRLIKAHLAKASRGKPTQRWTSEIFHAKYWSVIVFISPKGHRYVSAPRDAPADLIIQNRKVWKGIPFIRLQRFEKSAVAKQVKHDKRVETQHKRKSKVKRQRRVATKRQLTTLKS